MAQVNSPIPVIFFDETYDDGSPLAGGKLYAFEAGTSTPKVTYTEPTGSVASAHPIILNAAGRCSVWLAEGAYKWLLTDKDDNVIWTKDNTNLEDLSSTSTFAASISALRVVPIGQSNFATVIMSDSNALNYAWEEFSTAYDNGYSVIVPTAAPAVGRWILKSNGEVSSSVFTDLSDAILKIGNLSKITLTISRQETLVGNVTIPANITLKVIKGGSITGAFTLTMVGLLISDEIYIIDNNTTVAFAATSTHKVQSRWFTSLSRAIASCENANIMLEHDYAMTVNSNLTIPSNVILKIINAEATLSVGTGATLTIYGKLDADRIEIFTGAGTVKFGNGSVDYICPEWFGVDSSSPDNTAAFQKAVNSANDSTGFSPAIIKVASGEYTLTGTLTLPDNIILEGAGCNQTVLKHNPSTFINLIEGNGAYGIVIKDLGLKGRTPTTGNTKYLISLTNLNLNSYLSNLHLSNSVGYIYINNGTQAQMSNITCDASTHSPSDAGLSDSEWETVYGETTAPIYLIGMTAAVITDLRINDVGSIVNTTFGNPTSVFRMLNSDSAVINGLAISDCYHNGTYNLVSDYMASFIDCSGCSMNGLIFVRDYAPESILYFDRDCSFTIDGMSLVTVIAQNIINSTSAHDIDVNSLSVIDSQIITNCLVAQTGFSIGGKVNWTNSAVSVGKGYTDASISAYALNVTDTAEFGSSYREGIKDNDSNSDLFRIITPKISLVGNISTGSNANYTGVGVLPGHYLQIASGTYRSEQNVLHQIKRAVGTSAVDELCYFRLRPQSISSYYRLYVSETGSLYITSNGASTYTSDLGNWIYQFYVNASGEIKNYNDGVSPLDSTGLNQRLLSNGQYTGGSYLVNLMKSAAPVAGYWVAGDLVTNSQPIANEPFGWRCILSGAPGTWEPMTYVNIAAPINFGADVNVVGDIDVGDHISGQGLTLEKNQNGVFQPTYFANTYDVAGSSDEDILMQYIFRGGNSVTNRAGGTQRFAKIDTYDTPADCNSSYAISVGWNNTMFKTLEMSHDGGIVPYTRIQGSGMDDVASDTNITMFSDRNVASITGTTTIDRISSTNWSVGSIITLFFKGVGLTVRHSITSSGEFKTISLNKDGTGANVIFRGGDVAQFIYDGTAWRWISR